MNTPAGFEPQQFCQSFAMQGWCPYENCQLLHVPVTMFNQSPRNALTIGIQDNNSPGIPVSNSTNILSNVPLLDYTRSDYTSPTYERGNLENPSFPGQVEHVLAPQSEGWNSMPGFPVMLEGFRGVSTSNAFSQYGEPNQVLTKPVHAQFGNFPQYYQRDNTSIQNSPMSNQSEIFHQDMNNYFILKPAEESNSQRQMPTPTPEQHIHSPLNKNVPDLHAFSPSPIEVNITRKEDTGFPIKKECRYFSMYGSCHFGVGCKFEHVAKSDHTSPIPNLPQQIPYQEAGNYSFQQTQIPSSIKILQHPSSMQGGQRVNSNSNTSQSYLRNQSFETDYRVTEGNTQKNVCNYFLRGKCTYFDSCKFYHPSPPIPQSQTFNSVLQGMRPTSTPTKENRNQSDSEDSRKTSGISSSFSRMNISNRGINTVFSRQLGSNVTSRTLQVSDSINNENSGNEEYITFPNSAARYCKNYQLKGECSMGLRCRYLHSNPSSKINELSSSQENKFDKSAESVDVRKSEDARNKNYTTERGSKMENINKQAVSTKLIDQNQEPAKKSITILERKSDSKSENNQKRATCNPDAQPIRIIQPSRTFSQRPPFFKPAQTNPISRQEIKLQNLKPEELKKLRTTEIDQLKKRYPRAKRETTSTSDVFYLDVVPTDPEWPFDVKTINLQVTVPDQYPKEGIKLVVLEENNKDIPALLSRHLTDSVGKWVTEQYEELQKKGCTQLLFRPFLLWLDKSLEKLFTEGLRMVKRDIDAKAAGIEVVPFHKLPGAQNGSKEPSPETGIDSAQETSESDVSSTNLQISSSADRLLNALEKPQEEGYKHLSDEVKASNLGPAASSFTPRGTEISFRNLQLGGAAGTMTCQTFVFTVHCLRCKTPRDVNISGTKAHSYSCSKCSNQMIVAFRFSMMHQFSSTAGYLDLEGCRPFDAILPDCDFVISCLTCNKQCPASGLHPAQSGLFWCKFCNSKMSITIGNVKFQQLQPADRADRGKIQVFREKKEKRPRDPAIQEGKALPELGTCKHYRKSYRWMRFPCCGKLYPCDVCHDEKEKDHEMVLANRMVCGFCSKEQGFNGSKPCNFCSSNLTKTFTSHWEGGRGCRDKSRMNRNDNHKFAGLGKTIPRKNQKIQESKKKAEKSE